MKHLYIIGNGFDLHTGLATRYADFQRWLENNYPFIYENMQAVYDIDAEWWNDFEVQLGKLDINRFVSKFTPPAKPIDEIIAEAGFSFSPVDEDYMDWFFNNVPHTFQWEVSWFSEEDKNRIDKFIGDHLSLKDKLKTIRLENITNTAQ